MFFFNQYFLEYINIPLIFLMTFRANGSLTPEAVGMATMWAGFFYAVIGHYPNPFLSQAREKDQIAAASSQNT